MEIPARPASIPGDLQGLIVTMARAIPTWGEERIADELGLKFGLTVSPRTVGRISSSYGHPARSSFTTLDHLRTELRGRGPRL